MVEGDMIITSKVDAQGGESEAAERSDEEDTLSEEGKEEDDEEELGARSNDEERRLLDELEGLEEAEEEEYSGPLLAEEEGDLDDDDDDDEDDGDAEEEQAPLAQTDPDADDNAPVNDGGGDDDPDDNAPVNDGGDDDDRDDGQPGVLDFLTQPPEFDPGSPQEQADFFREIEQFFASRKMDYRPPKFYGETLNLLKLWRTVVRLGAYDYVTAHKLWRQVGETFNPPKKCTTVSWSFRIFYEKSLLDYERHMLRGTGYASGQGGGSHVDTAEDAPGAVQNGASQPQGRVRRDAAMRAMQGWHSQKILDNEEFEATNTKHKNSTHMGRQEKQFNPGVLKRQNLSIPERAVKGARLMNGGRAYVPDDVYGHQAYNSMQRKQPFKQDLAKQVLRSSNHNLVNGADIRVADEGPDADWVKINVHQTCDCFEVYVLVPGLLQEELRIQCEPGGLLVIIGEPEQLNNPWGVTPFKKVIKLPSPIDANQTSAVITLHGQLFVRVPYGEGHA